MIFYSFTFKSATFYYLPMNQIFTFDFLALVLWLGIQRIDIWDDISWRYISAIQSGWSKQLQSITIPNQWVSIKNSFSTHFTIFISQFTRVLQFWFRYRIMYINRRESIFTLTRWAFELWTKWCPRTAWVAEKYPTFNLKKFCVQMPIEDA